MKNRKRQTLGRVAAEGRRGDDAAGALDEHRAVLREPRHLRSGAVAGIF